MAARSLALRGQCRQALARHQDYSLREMEDMPEVRNWTWTDDFEIH
jgi:phosphoketolase